MDLLLSRHKHTSYNQPADLDRLPRDFDAFLPVQVVTSQFPDLLKKVFFIGYSNLFFNFKATSVSSTILDRDIMDIMAQINVNVIYIPKVRDFDCLSYSI